MQNAKAPMIIALVINILNIVLNIFFVFGLGMNADGVALGTVIAQYAGFSIATIIFFRKYNHFLKYFSYDLLRKLSGFKVFVNVNKDKAW